MVDNRSTEQDEMAPSQLRILLCSDMHENWTNLDKLLAREEAGSFDFVFVSGDQANGLHAVGQELNQESETKCIASNKRIVETLGAMHKPAGKVIYIPGNHDAQLLMDAEAMPPINEKSINLHNRVEELIPGLFIAGLGGSLPTLFQPNGSEEWEQVFTPYPFTSESLYTQAIQALWFDKVDPIATGQKQVILMTHDGPQDYLTAINDYRVWSPPQDRKGYYKFGSIGLRDLIRDKKEKLVVHIHGHSHDGAFSDKVHGGEHTFPIINPGSLNF